MFINDDCVTARWIYVNDVVAASQEQLDQKCGNCSTCYLVNKVIELSNIVRDPCLDSTVEVSSIFTPIPVPRVHGTITTTNGAKQTYYLDLVPESGKIIEVSWVKIAHQKDSIITTSYVGKTDELSEDNYDIVLTSTEILLDNLIIAYKKRILTSVERQRQELEARELEGIELEANDPKAGTNALMNVQINEAYSLRPEDFNTPEPVVTPTPSDLLEELPGRSIEYANDIEAMSNTQTQAEIATTEKEHSTPSTSRKRRTPRTRKSKAKPANKRTPKRRRRKPGRKKTTPTTRRRSIKEKPIQQQTPRATERVARESEREQVSTPEMVFDELDDEPGPRQRNGG